MDLALFRLLKGQQGVTVIMVALLILIFIGVAALAIDMGHLFIVRNELQNAADAGCLAGTRFLYRDDGKAVNEDANQVAHDAAIANKSEKSPVEVAWSGGNEGDVERGHWSFTTRTFTPNSSIEPTDLWNVSAEELDGNPNFINAIRVRTRRQDTPAVSLLASILGYNNFSLSTEAIAYTGFAGTLAPGEADQPIAICKESLLIDDKYSCAVGRMMTMGEVVPGQETGGWTDFNQDDPCPSGTNAPTVVSLVASGGNPDRIIVGQPIATNPNDISSAFTNLRQRWEEATVGPLGPRTQAWTLTLPVVECPDNDMGNCGRMVGAVTVNILWMIEDYDSSYGEAPLAMGTWSSSDPDGHVRWNSFVQHFNLRKLDGSLAPYQSKSIYFLPDCNYHQPKGRTGGENFGIMAKIPLLAK
jgi:hypothetical protein